MLPNMTFSYVRGDFNCSCQAGQLLGQVALRGLHAGQRVLRLVELVGVGILQVRQARLHRSLAILIDLQAGLQAVGLGGDDAGIAQQVRHQVCNLVTIPFLDDVVLVVSGSVPVKRLAMPAKLLVAAVDSLVASSASVPSFWKRCRCRTAC
jgi:hypothetical protein